MYRMKGLKSLYTTKTIFKMCENGVFNIDFQEVIVLKTLKLKNARKLIRYVFPHTIKILEM